MTGSCGLKLQIPLKKDSAMTVRIENQTCFFTTENGEQIRLCPDVTIVTDGRKAMSAVDIEGQRIYITEAEADALTVAGAVDGRRHLKASDSDSVI
jgi:hypothetical protein